MKTPVLSHSPSCAVGSRPGVSLLASLFLISIQAAPAQAQDGWREFKAGDLVVVTQTDGHSVEGEIKEIDDAGVQVKKGKWGSVRIARDQVLKIEAAAAPEEAGDGGTGGSSDPEGGSGAAGGDAFDVEVATQGLVTLVPGAKVDVTMKGRPRPYSGYMVERLEGSSLVLSRFGHEVPVAVDEITGLVVVSMPSSASGTAAGDGPEDGGGETGEAETVTGSAARDKDWPPQMGARVIVVAKDDTESIRGTVTAIEGERVTLETSDGPFTFGRDDLERWKLTGVSIGYMQAARLMRHYAINIKPDWAKRFVPTGGLHRAQIELELLSVIKVKPTPVLAPAKLPTGKAGSSRRSDSGEDDVSDEVEILTRYYDHMRSRYLAMAEKEIDYFFERDLFEDERGVRKTFAELRKEKSSKPVDHDFTYIGTSLNNRFKQMGDEIRELENSRTPIEEIDARKAELAEHREVSARLLDDIAKFERFRKLAFAEEETLERALLEWWNRTHKKIQTELKVPSNGSLRDRIESWEMPRSGCAVFDLTEKGRDDVLANLETLYGEAETVPFEKEEWLFNRALRQVTATMLPSKNAFMAALGSGGTDRGAAAVTHLNVYRFEGAEICRMVLFRIEPELHVRILLWRDRLLFCEAEEWIHGGW